ncbi:hypothetical protein K2173_017652 [Erythroxylum novogranatense]|uniref:Uncharacterized protein n=1 Tax=Erythroxylum novogranatense TaxID=1862640 RepID=A0AAV8T2R4_9ROSI|nr:hypothetical protein K2173_017652 [Erythroxylum novogranatense]
MADYSLSIDAWLREAQEVSKLVEDIESRIRNKDLAHEHRLRIRDTALSKLLGVGVKLDHLETLLHNPPPKLFLTERDLEFRWKLLSDLRLRTRTLALNLASLAPLKSVGKLPAAETKEVNQTTGIYGQGSVKLPFTKDDPQLLKPLLPEDETTSGMQIKQFSPCISSRLLTKVCWTICLILGAVALLCILFFLIAMM